MSISSISSATSSYALQNVQSPEVRESRATPDRDRDADNRGSTNAIGPTTNTSGQMLGQLINAVA
jgi:hypothetical protein